MTESLHIERYIVETAERLWSALTDVDRLAQWFCSNPDSVCDVVADVRPGGTFRIEVPNEFELECTYVNVQQPNLLEMEWRDKAISEQRAAVSGDASDDVERRLVFALESSGNGTRVSVTQTGIADAERAAWARGAWDRALGRLTTTI